MNGIREKSLFFWIKSFRRGFFSSILCFIYYQPQHLNRKSNIYIYKHKLFFQYKVILLVKLHFKSVETIIQKEISNRIQFALYNK